MFVDRSFGFIYVDEPPPSPIGEWERGVCMGA